MGGSGPAERPRIGAPLILKLDPHEMSEQPRDLLSSLPVEVCQSFCSELHIFFDTIPAAEISRRVLSSFCMKYSFMRCPTPFQSSADACTIYSGPPLLPSRPTTSWGAVSPVRTNPAAPPSSHSLCATPSAAHPKCSMRSSGSLRQPVRQTWLLSSACQDGCSGGSVLQEKRRSPCCATCMGIGTRPFALCRTRTRASH